MKRPKDKQFHQTGFINGPSMVGYKKSPFTILQRKPPKLAQTGSELWLLKYSTTCLESLGNLSFPSSFFPGQGPSSYSLTCPSFEHVLLATCHQLRFCFFCRTSWPPPVFHMLYSLLQGDFASTNTLDHFSDYIYLLVCPTLNYELSEGPDLPCSFTAAQSSPLPGTKRGNIQNVYRMNELLNSFSNLFILRLDSEKPSVIKLVHI